MHYVTGTATELGARLWSALGHYRYKVFVQHLGWDLPDATENGEWDQFDRPETVYVIALSAMGGIAGCARLLPTTRDYLLADVFPQLLDGSPAPRSPTTWELSRFTALDASVPAGTPHTLGSPRALDLLRAAMHEATCRGARTLVSVSPVAIQRILRHAGFQYAALGRTHHIDGHALFACSMAMRPALDSVSGRPTRTRDQSRYPVAPVSISPQEAVHFRGDRRTRDAYRAFQTTALMQQTMKD